jgi:PAS domain S-box-containing protein
METDGGARRRDRAVGEFSLADEVRPDLTPATSVGTPGPAVTRRANANPTAPAAAAVENSSVDPLTSRVATRVRSALLGIIAAELVFTVSDLWLPPGMRAPVLGLKAAQVVVLLLALSILSDLRSRRAIIGTALGAGSAVLLGIAATRGMTGDVPMAVVLTLGLVLAASTWIPWGALAQLAFASVGVFAMLNALVVAQIGLGTAWSSAGFGIGCALATSVFVATVLKRQLRAGDLLDAARASAEEARRRSEDDLRRVFETLEDIYYRTDLDGRILAVSPAVTRYGYTVAELIGSDVRRIHENASRRRGNFTQLLQDGHVRDYELRLLAKDGTQVPMSANVRLLHDADGRPAAVEGMLRDIRDRKHAEEELRVANELLDERVRARTADLQVANALLRQASEAAHEAERRFRTVSELTSDYAYCFRLTPQYTTEVEWVTASFERVTGYGIAELDAVLGGIGIVHPDDLGIAQARIMALLAGQLDVSEFRIIRKDGEVRWIREHGYAEREGGDSGRVVRIYGAAQDVTERKRVQAELGAAQRQRDNVMATVPDVIYSLDCTGRLVDWNRRLEVVSGRDAAQIAGAEAPEFFLAEDRQHIGEAIARAFDDGYADVEARMETPLGPRLYQYTAVPLRGEDGELVGLTGVGRDVSELKDAQNRTAVLLEVARDVSGTLDVNEILTRIQRRTAELLPCDMVVTLCWDREVSAFTARAHHGVPPDLVEQVERLVLPLGASFASRPQHREVIVLDDLSSVPDVAAIIAEGALIAAPLRARGRYLGCLVALRRGAVAGFAPAQVELCEGIAAQLALTMEGAELYRRQREEATISRAIARVGQELISALDGPDLLGQLARVTVDVLGCDASLTALHRPAENTYVSVASHGFAPDVAERIRLLDVPAVIVPGASTDADSPARNLIDVSGSPSVQRVLAASLGMHQVLLMPLFRGNEQIGMHIACYLRPERSFSRVDERIAQRIAQLASLTIDHARAVAETNEASRLKSEFVATMSHELRTPLNVILGYNEMLLDGAFGDLSDAQREGLERADRSARHLLSLISDTLDLSRLEAGRVALQLSEFSLDEIAREAITQASEHGAKVGVHISCEVPADLPRLHGDAGKLRVVIGNLLGNALKFTDAGDVRLVAARLGDDVEIVVHDTGTGISDETLAYVFEPFRQGDGSLTREHDGAGLGLYIVRRLLDVLGGSVGVESRVGIGSTFRVRVPMQVNGRLAA